MPRRSFSGAVCADFRLFWAGQSVSQTGSQVMSVWRLRTVPTVPLIALEDGLPDGDEMPAQRETAAVRSLQPNRWPL